MSERMGAHERRPSAARVPTRPRERAHPAARIADVREQDGSRPPPAWLLSGLAPGKAPSPTDLMALQRTVGNRATANLLRQPAAVAARIQRAPTPTQTRAFAKRYLALLMALDGELRNHGRIRITREQVGELADLLETAVVLEFETDLPSLFQQVATLAALARQYAALDAEGEEAAEMKIEHRIKAVLAETWPGARRADAAFTSMAAALFSPSVTAGRNQPGQATGGGAFAGPEMRKRAAAEARELSTHQETGEKEQDRGSKWKGKEKEKEKEREEERPDVEVDVRINLVLQAMREAYLAHRHQHRGRRGPNAPFDRTLLIFLGPEWYFRRPDRPYTREERNRITSSIVEMSTLYPEMLVMPGTIISADNPSGKGWTNLTNTAIVAWNGSLLAVIDKQRDAGDTRGLVSPLRFQPGDQSSTFNLGDLTFAIDICVDHFGQRAQKQTQSADVHLITGQGQSVHPPATATRHGGFAVRSDSDHTRDPSTLAQIDTSGGERTKHMASGIVLEQETSEREIYEGKVEQFQKPLLTYHRARPFESDWRASSTRTLHLVNARTGATIGARPLPAPTNEPVTIGHRRPPRYMGTHRTDPDLPKDS